MVDAICVNQNDIDERNNQVPLMGTLYSGAEKVIIWLGEADKTTDELVHVIQETDFSASPAKDTDDYEDSSLQYRIKITRMMFLVVIVGLRPWWGRVWTVQECVLARSDPIFRCGFHIFSWQGFFDVAIKTLENVQQILTSLQEIIQNNSSIREMLLFKGQLSKDAGDRKTNKYLQECYRWKLFAEDGK
jgi:hypothetical protein